MKRIKYFKVGGAQIFVEAYPKSRDVIPTNRKNIDVLRLTIKSMNEKNGSVEKKVMYMTPDEALQISNILNSAGCFWLMNYKPYQSYFMKKKEELAKKGRKHKSLRKYL